jgi:signal transduction histidine kinase
MKSLRDYFIGGLLEEEPDVLRRASILLIYNIISVSVGAMVIVFFVYVVKGFQYQLIKTVVVLTFFIGILFYLRANKSVVVICHLLIAISYANNVANIYLFDDFNFFIALLTVCNIIFAFHTLGSKAGIAYSIIHFVPILLHTTGKYMGIHFAKDPPQQLAFVEVLVTMCLVFFIIVYLVYHYHQAYELAKIGIQKSVEDLRTAKDLAEESNRLKTNFLSNMSHEIRTPINGILGISQVMELETDNETLLKYIQLQQQSGRRLLNTITSILNLSRIEAERSQLKLNAIDVNTLVSESILPLAELAKGKSLAFSFKPAVENTTCQSDETMLYQVINNIVGNAIKFTDKGSITITTRVDNQKVYIGVQDTGVGIAEDFLGRIFNSFEQESTGRDRSHEGSGLGLSISKKYIELMDGEILVQSEKNVGSTFEIVLPAYPI